MLSLWVASVLLVGSAAANHRHRHKPKQGRARAARGGQVIVVKLADTRAYEEATEELLERCSATTEVITLGDEPIALDVRNGSRTLIVTVGQEAFDAVETWREATKASVEIFPVLALHLPPPVPVQAQPIVALFDELRELRPKTKRVGVVHGKRSLAAVEFARARLKPLGIELISTLVADGPGAVSALHALAPRIDALWLAPDADVVTPQVFAFGLALQQRRGLPLLATTEEQVRSGALLGATFAPREVGRDAAEFANRWLDAPRRSSAPPPSPKAHVYTNELVARRLGLER